VCGFFFWPHKCSKKKIFLTSKNLEIIIEREGKRRKRRKPVHKVKRRNNRRPTTL
jgi:hypothetical protein